MLFIIICNKACYPLYERLRVFCCKWKGEWNMSLYQYRLRELEEVKKADFITVPEASLLTCIGLNHLYELTKELDADFVIHVGTNRRRCLIDRQRFLSYLKRKG